MADDTSTRDADAVEASGGGVMQKLLDGIEVADNKVPHPVMMFLYLIIGALIIAVAALSYELYRERKAPPEGVHIDIGPKGLSIEKK